MGTTMSELLESLLKRERLIRLPEVKARTGLGTTTVYRRMNEGTFPRPINLGGGRVAWIESQIDAWIQACIDASATHGDTDDAEA
jgi:prophage regulatory protein